MMADSGVPGDEILVALGLLILEAMGESHEEAEKDAAGGREVLTTVEAGSDDAVFGESE